MICTVPGCIILRLVLDKLFYFYCKRNIQQKLTNSELMVNELREKFESTKEENKRLENVKTSRKNFSSTLERKQKIFKI